MLKLLKPKLGVLFEACGKLACIALMHGSEKITILIGKIFDEIYQLIDDV